MPVASKFPLGFLDLIGAQNFGENPRLVADQVNPIVDIGEQYLVSTQVMLAGSAGGGVNGFNAFIPDLVVPVGQMWRLLAFSVGISTNVGVTASFAPSLRPVVGTGGRLSLADQRDIAASRVENTASRGLPLWLLSGAQLGIELQNVAGGNPGFSGQALVQVLRA